MHLYGKKHLKILFSKTEDALWLNLCIYYWEHLHVCSGYVTQVSELWPVGLLFWFYFSGLSNRIMRKMFSHWRLEPVYSLTSPLSEFLLMLLSVHAESCLTLIICFFSLSFFFFIFYYFFIDMFVISPWEAICMKCRRLFFGKEIRKILSICAGLSGSGDQEVMGSTPALSQHSFVEI